MTSRLSPQPFDMFRESLAAATYEDARQAPGAVVESPQAFEEMKEYLLQEYRGVRPRPPEVDEPQAD